MSLQINGQTCVLVTLADGTPLNDIAAPDALIYAREIGNVSFSLSCSKFSLLLFNISLFANCIFHCHLTFHRVTLCLIPLASETCSSLAAQWVGTDINPRLVTSHVDYCNSVLSFVPKKVMDYLCKHVQNAAARLVVTGDPEIWAWSL